MATVGFKGLISVSERSRSESERVLHRTTVDLRVLIGFRSRHSDIHAYDTSLNSFVQHFVCCDLI